MTNKFPQNPAKIVGITKRFAIIITCLQNHLIELNNKTRRRRRPTCFRTISPHCSLALLAYSDDVCELSVNIHLEQKRKIAEVNLTRLDNVRIGLVSRSRILMFVVVFSLEIGFLWWNHFYLLVYWNFVWLSVSVSVCGKT